MNTGAYLVQGARMSFEDLENDPAGGDSLHALIREDLEPYSVTDLETRIAALEAEIARVKAAIVSKSSQRSAADALFKF